MIKSTYYIIKPDSYYEKRQRAYVFFTENQNYINGLSVYIIMKSEDDAQGAIAPIFLNTKTHWIRTTA